MSEEDIFEFSDEEFSADIGRYQQEGAETKALLVGMYSHSKDIPICEEHLSELHELADTFGVTTVGSMSCSLKKIDASTYIHQGKLEELLEAVRQKNANLVILLLRIKILFFVPIYLIVPFGEILKITHRTNVAADSESRLANARRFPRR